jgi:flagellar biosynthetic protein FliO
MFKDPIMNTFFSLFLIVAVLGFVLFIVKRYAIKMKKNKPDGMEMEVVSRIALQQKTHLFIVKAGNKKLLIGSNEHSINTLADLTEEKPIPQGIPVNKNTKIPAQRAIQKFKNQTQSENAIIDNLSFKKFLTQTFRKQ